jgi:hypothetical protein
MVANFSAYVWWYIRRSYGPIDDSGNITKRGYMMSQYTKFVRPGYIRVDAPAAPATNVNVTAYKSDTSMVVVIVNKNTSSKTQQFTIKNGAVSSFNQYVSSGTKNISNDGTVKVEDGVFTVTLDAQSVTTLVGKATVVGVINSDKKNLEENAYRIFATNGAVKSDVAVYDLKGNLIKNYSTAGFASKGKSLNSGIYIIKRGKAKATKRVNVIHGQ